MRLFPDESSHSASLFERACKVLPGGNSRFTTFQLPYPIYAQSAEGIHIVDVDGSKRIDFLNNYTSLIHGHRHPAIVAAMVAQAQRLGAVAMTTEVEIELAELLCDRIPSLDQIRFTNSGTEGVMQALRAARAYTGRPKIAKCEGLYHGAYDYAEPTYGMQREDFATPAPASVPYAEGTPKGALNDVVVIPYNDPEAIERLLVPHADQLASLIVDPLPTSLGTISVTREFVEAARRFTTAHDIILIFDEVVSFRIAAGGAQEVLGVQPDLTALGKIIGGGLPIGAVGGRREVMSVFDARRGRPALPHGGTFNANPITMAAGLAAMSQMTPAEYERINRLGDLVRQEIRNAIRQPTSRAKSPAPDRFFTCICITGHHRLPQLLSKPRGDCVAGTTLSLSAEPRDPRCAPRSRSAVDPNGAKHDRSTGGDRALCATGVKLGSGGATG